MSEHPAAGCIRVRHLAIRDFRNLERVTLDLPAAGLVLMGENGHGKTNFLEAIYYLQLFRSARGARDVDVVRFGAAGFHVAATAEGTSAHTIGVGFERAGKRKRVRVDGAEVPRLSDALGALPSVMLSPRDAELVSGPPSERRRFLDVVLALTDRRYLAALQGYRGALVRRNAALRDAARGGAAEQQVAVWEPALARHGAVIHLARRRWAERVAERFAALCAAIGERGAARLRYVSPLPHALDTPEAVEGALLHALEAKRALDIRRGLTHAGPHRDDLELMLAGAEGTLRELRSFASAGQQRTAAIALRILEGETLRDAHGAAPVYLLDDPFAELDVRRSARILDLLAHSGLGQTILTVPRESDIPAELTRLERWRIVDGVVTSQERGVRRQE